MQSSMSSAFASANRGPLTTIFTPPASCLSETTLVSYLTTTSASSASSVAGSASTPSVSASGFTTTKIFINHYSWGDSACYPPSIATIDGSTRWNNGYYYCMTHFSKKWQGNADKRSAPGICPSGWTSACTQRTNAFGFSTTIQSETTAVMCCPSYVPNSLKRALSNKT